MNKTLEIIKGIHPGFYLERELKKRKISKGRLALAVHEYPQTLVAITKGKRRMNTPLAMKIEKELGMEEGFLTLLQAYHEIEEERKKTSPKPDLKKFRKVVFWDTNMEKFDWIKQRGAIIRRVYERGNDREKAEIMRFYGEKEVNLQLKMSDG